MMANLKNDVPSGRQKRDQSGLVGPILSVPIFVKSHLGAQPPFQSFKQHQPPQPKHIYTNKFQQKNVKPQIAWLWLQISKLSHDFAGDDLPISGRPNRTPRAPWEPREVPGRQSPRRWIPFQLVRQCAAHRVSGDDDAIPMGSRLRRIESGDESKLEAPGGNTNGIKYIYMYIDIYETANMSI